MSPAELAAIAQRQQRASRGLAIAGVISTVIAMPAGWAVYRYLDWAANPWQAGPFTWSWEVLRRSLVNGTFWTHPTEAIFQAPSLQIGDSWFSITAAFGIMALAAYGGSWLLHGVPMLVAISQLGTGVLGLSATRGKQEVPPGRIAQLMIPSLARSRGRLIELPGEKMTPVVYNVGADLIVAVPLRRGMPEAVIDSRSNRVERRNGVRLILPASAEVVLDGTTFETSRIYVADAVRDRSPVLFSPAVTSIVVKQLPNADIIVDNRVLTVAVAVEDAADERSLEHVATAAVRLARALTSQAERIRKLPGEAKLTGVLSVGSETGVMRWRLWTRIARHSPTWILLTIGCVIAGTLSYLAGRGGDQSELIAFAAIASVFLVHGIGRRVRAMLSFDAPVGTEAGKGSR